MKNGRDIAERRYWERNKRKINKKEKTTQQQKGLPTLSADLNYMCTPFLYQGNTFTLN